MILKLFDCVIYKVVSQVFSGSNHCDIWNDHVSFTHKTVSSKSDHTVRRYYNSQKQLYSALAIKHFWVIPGVSINEFSQSHTNFPNLCRLETCCVIGNHCWAFLHLITTINLIASNSTLLRLKE